MAGVLFLVHIPSVWYEKILRQREKEKLAQTADAKLEDEKPASVGVAAEENAEFSPVLTGGGTGGNEEAQPFLTPQPRKHQIKEKEELRRSLLDLTDSQQQQAKKPPEGNGVDDHPSIPFIDCQEVTAGDGTNGPVVKTPTTEDQNGSAQPKDSLTVPFDRTSALRRSWEGFKDILGSARKEKAKDPRDIVVESMNLDGDSSLEDIMKVIIQEKRIHTAAWIETNKGKGYQIMFSLESGNKCDDVIYLLSSWGIGERFNSTISITSCTLFNERPKEEEEKASEAAGSKEGPWNNFLSSVRARLNVAQIVEEVKHDATITFDFVSMLVIAGLVAAFGLIEDSSVNLTDDDGPHDAKPSSPDATGYDALSVPHVRGSFGRPELQLPRNATGPPRNAHGVPNSSSGVLSSSSSEQCHESMGAASSSASSRWPSGADSRLLPEPSSTGSDSGTLPGGSEHDDFATTARTATASAEFGASASARETTTSSASTSC